jgi:CRP-like cAMP-binding protein
MDAGPLLRKLESIGTPTEEERQALSRLRVTVRTYGAREDIVRERDRPNVVCLLLEGFACRYTLVASGKRQIMAFHIAGDIPDLQSLFLSEMDHSIGTLVPTRIAAIPHGAMCSLIDRNPRIAHLLWRDSLIDAAIFRQWMVGIGRRTAYARIAHMICEFVQRMKAVGLSDGKTCQLPITQSDIADALGLTNVHVNRTVAELKLSGLMAWERGLLTIRDWDGLQKAGEFDPMYLQLQHSQA